MAKFQYKARDKNGKEITGYKDAQTRYELARFLRNEGSLLLSAEELGDDKAVKKTPPLLVQIQALLNKISRVKLADKIIFTKNLGVMVGAGLSVTRALDALSNETQNVKFKEAITDIADQIRKGKALGESFSVHSGIFPPLYISMIEAGEKSGKLKESLMILASQMKADYDLSRKVRGALIYPGVILAAMVIIGILMLIYVVPTLTSVFKELNVELPVTTQFVIGASNFVVHNSILVLVGFVVLIGGFIQFKRSRPGKMLLDRVVIRFPLIGPLAKKFNAARTARTLSSLISAGVQILEALDITSRVVQNHLYSNILIEAKTSVQRGETISKIFLLNQKLYPSLMSEMLAVGEETGQSSKMLEEVADFYEQQVSDATKDLSTIVEPLLMVVIGAVVGFFAISMISPMYSLTDAIN